MKLIGHALFIPVSAFHDLARLFHIDPDQEHAVRPDEVPKRRQQATGADRLNVAYRAPREKEDAAPSHAQDGNGQAIQIEKVSRNASHRQLGIQLGEVLNRLLMNCVEISMAT